jgi:hypothetical protein
MKKKSNALYLITILISLIITSVGCKKDKVEPTMSAKVNGVAWSSSTITGELEKLAFIDSKEMTINGGFNDNKSIELIISENTAVGDGITLSTYQMGGTFGGTTLRFVEFFPPGATVNYSGPFEGSVTVTQCDPVAKTISGTFNAKINDTPDVITITDGTFTNISYTVK